MAVATPRFARESAWRAFSAVAGSFIIADAFSEFSATDWRACSAAAFAWSAACDAACFARSRKLIGRPSKLLRPNRRSRAAPTIRAAYPARHPAAARSRGLLCDAPSVDWFVPLLLAVGVVVLALAIGAALARGRELGAIAGRLGTAPNGEAILERVALLQGRVEAAEVTLDQRLRDVAYLADLIGVGIVRVDDDLRVEMANAAAHVLLERAPGSMLGRTAIEALGDHRLEDLVRDAGDRGASTIEISLRDPDGPALLARARRSPILGTWLVLEDVAELRRLQRIRAEFVDNLSHELRTPITTIGLLAETLARDAEAAGDSVPTKMKERIGKLEVETGTIAQMITELLDLARIESGSRQLLLDEVDLGQGGRRCG